MKKIQIGDVFACKLSEGHSYFQYIGNDASQLGGNIIAVFSKKFDPTESIDLCGLDGLDISFFALAIIKIGIKLNAWEKVGNAPVVKHNPILFRNTNDYGKPEITESDDWWVWAPNEAQVRIGPLVGKYRQSYIGVVMAVPNIIDRLKTGKYSYFYPAPKGEGVMTQ